jgi:hypothetical protein
VVCQTQLRCAANGRKRTLATHITKKAGYNKKTAQTGAVTLIQRFGTALNLNIHLTLLIAKLIAKPRITCETGLP